MPTQALHGEQRYLCFGNNPLDGQLYDHEVKALSYDHARRRHFDIYGYNPAKIKLLGCVTRQERKTVTLPAKEMANRTTKRWRGLHQGWVVYANGIASCTVDGVSYRDNELVDIIFDHPVKKGTHCPKRHKDWVVRLTAVTDLIELD